MTIKEFAKRTGIKPDEISDLIYNHRVKARKVKGKFIISDDPSQWLKDNPKYNQEVGETLDSARKVKSSKNNNTRITKKSIANLEMKTISDSAKERIAKVFNESFKDILKALNEHAETMPTNMRKELLQAIKRGCEKHNLHKVFSSIDYVSNTINNKYIPLLKDIKKNTDTACQASEKWVTREYLDAQIERVLSHTKIAIEKMVTRKEHVHVKKLAEENRSATAELVTQRNLEILQTDLDNQLTGMSIRLKTKESLDNKLYQYVKYGLIGIGSIAVLSVVNLLLVILL